MPTDADNVNASIAENAQGVKSSKSDEGEVEQHPLRDQIAAAQHLAGKTAARKPHRGLRITQVVKPSPE